MTNLSEKPVTMNTQDRCDVCGAQAFVRAEFLNGELLFCGHHWRAHEVSATTKVIRVHDFTDTINAKPGVSVN